MGKAKLRFRFPGVFAFVLFYILARLSLTVVVVVVVVWTHYCLKSCRKPTAALQIKLE